MQLTQRDVFKRLALWTGVCSISAAPSFIWAAQEFDRLAMITGVLLFIIAMTAMTCTRTFEHFEARPFVRRTLYIGYGGRLLISIAFPIGMFVDLWPGVISMELVQSLGLETRAFLGTLLITLVQGGILNVILMLFMGLVQGFQRLFLKPPPPTHCCHRCRYDLRASAASAVCPECGTPIRDERRRAEPVPAAA